MQSNVLFIEPGTERVPTRAPMALRPILDQAISDIVYSSPKTLLDLVDRYGSPLNIVWPHALRQNVEAFRTVLRSHKVRFEIFYGAKVNKSQALLRAAAESNVGVDVSSVYELRDALRAGADPSRLCATGPAKTSNFHAELIANASLISIDSVEELYELEECVRKIPSIRMARVLLRYRSASSQASRFGMGADDLLHCLHRLAKLRTQFAFEGFHFHLGGYSYETRAQALRELIHYINAARNLDLEPKIIDIGGGMPIRYVESDKYEAYLHHQCNEHYSHGRVPESFYPYGSRLDACAWLNRLLGSSCVDGLSIAQYLNAMDITLAIEPGRSLADQAAISVFRITRIKLLAAGNHVIFVEGSSFSACETWFASEFLVDPILISTEAVGQIRNAPIQAYIAGHSCLDDDVITHRLIGFKRIPKAGDLLVYANTAAYQMDLLENEFHRHPLPRRITATCNASGGIDVSPDDQTE